MKYMRLLSFMVMLAGSMFSLAQEYKVTKTFNEQRCTDDTPFIWRGQTITTSGTYNDTTKYADPDWGITGEIEQMNVTFTNHLKFSKYYEIKKGQTIEFRGKTYDTEGTYTDKKPSITACDTTYKITIAWSEDYHFYETKNICKSDAPYLWRGKVCSYTGEYLQTYRTKDNKNDSIYHLYLNVYAAGEYTKYVTICEDELPYQFGTRQISEPGTYTDTIHQSYGCLDTIHVVLKVVPRPYTKQEVKFCKNEGYKHDSTIYYDRHTFMDTIRRISGCDSIVETTCVPLPTYLFETRGGHRAGEPYVWDHNGKTYTKDSNYYEFYKTKEGCDSIYALYVTTTYETFVNIKACQGDTIVHHGQIVTDSTKFPIRDTLSSIMGGDSILLVTYQFMPRYYFMERTNICHGDTVEWLGHTDLKGNQIFLTEGGAYFDRKTSVFGCDSIYEMQVTILPKYSYDTTILICNDSIREKPYIWTDAHGKQHEYWKTDADTTIFEVLNHTPVLPLEDYLDGDVWYRALSGGCDSTWQMRIITKDCGNDTAYLCKGSSVMVNGVKYTKAGDYVQCVRSTMAEVCDSICRVHIKEVPTYNTNEWDTISVCPSELPYTWTKKAHGKTFSKKVSLTGDYALTLPTIYGCDSIVHLHFTVFPKYQIYEATRNVCRGDTIYINRVTHEGKYTEVPIWQDTVFHDTLHTKYGCDSIIVYTVNQARDFFYDKVDHFRKDSIYWWHNHGDSIAISQPGVYFDSCRTVDGCDSIYRITLSWDLPRYYQDSDSVCANDLPYKWHNMEFFTDTFVVDSMVSPMGMDSIFEFKLKVLPKYASDEFISICSGQTYKFKEQLITQSGVYIDTMVAKQNGCDSVVRYHINMLPRHFFDEQISLGANQTYEWKGHDRIINQPGWYYDSLSTQAGCDSIYRLHVIEDKSFLKGETVTICASDTPYEWHGQFLSKDGTFYDRHEVRPGVDSTYYINLTINPTYLIESTVNLCAGGSYSFFGRTLTASGVYEEAMTSSLGCDSIYRVTINRLGSNIVNQQYSICPGERLEVADTIVFNACQFRRVYPSSNGCDSTVIFLINELPSYKRTTHDVLCEGNNYIWKRLHRPDTVLSTPGTYRDVYPIENGCDSVFELILNMSQASRWDTTIYVCPDESYFYDNVEYFTSNDFTKNYVNQYGCDSIRTYHYRVMRYCSPHENYLHCKGVAVLIDGRYYTNDGEYRELWNRDSLHRFSINAHPTYEYSKNLGVYCDSVVYEGKTYYAHGLEKATFTIDRYMHTKQHGCDSIEHVTMTIYPSSYSEPYQLTINDYEYVVFGNEMYSKTGIYIHRNHTIFGCDSINGLDLKVNSTEYPEGLPRFYCASSDKPLIVFDKSYRPTKDTIIYYTTEIPHTDLKVVTKINVTVEEAFHINKIIPDKEVCAENNVQFDIAFTSLGGLPKRYTLTFLDNDLKAVPGVQSQSIDPYSSILHINMTGQGSCVRPGTYPYKLELQGEHCNLNDTAFYDEILVRYPASVMEANWDNVIALYNETRNAGAWVFEPPYIWQVWNKYGEDKTALVAPSDPAQPYIYSNNLSEGDMVVVTLLRQGYKNAVPSCQFEFQPATYSKDYTVMITPTTARRSAFVTIQSSSDGFYQLVDNAGNIHQSGVYHSGEQQLQVPSAAGCYLIHLINDRDACITKKIIVY